MQRAAVEYAWCSGHPFPGHWPQGIWTIVNMTWPLDIVTVTGASRDTRHMNVMNIPLRLVFIYSDLNRAQCNKMKLSGTELQRSRDQRTSNRSQTPSLVSRL